MRVLQMRVARAGRGIMATFVAGSVMVGGGAAVVADDVSNNIDATVDAVAEVMALNAEGPSGSTTLRIVAQNGDGKNGCNLTGSTALVVSVTSSNPGVAAVTPSSLTFDSCGATRLVAVTPVSSGSTTVSLSQTSNTTGGSFNLAPATFTVNVASPTPANAAPAVNVTGVAMGASYEFGNVPTALCAVTDAEDGTTSFAASLGPIEGALAEFGLGSQQASCSYTDGGGLMATSSVTYSIVDTILPSITPESRTPSANEDGWNNTPVTVAWSCADVGSGVLEATVTQTVSGEGMGQSATATCTDRAGNSVSNTVEEIKIDKTAPALTATRTPANSFGWNNTDVTVTWDCTDELSGVALSPSQETVSSEAAGQSTAGTCADKAGNTTSTTVEDINIDKTAPTLTGSRTPAANDAGWNNTDVTVEWSCDDDLSTVDSVSQPETVTGEAAGQSAAGTCTDKAGNTADAKVEDINIDKTAPSIGWNGGPANGADYIFGSVPAAPTCSASDQEQLSGPGTCEVVGHSPAVGSHTLTATAYDRAGNEHEETRTYTVQAWTLRGFYQPVDMNGVWNTVKNGSTVPLKFEVFAGATELTDPSIAAFTVTQVACDTGAGFDDIELTTTGGTSLRYDSTGGQFIQNWQTPKNPGTCYQVTMKTADGSTLSARFKLK